MSNAAPKPIIVVRSQGQLSWGWSVLAALVSGGLMATAFEVRPLHFLSWVALVPWLIVLPRISSGRAWLFGTLLGLVFYRIGLGWLCSLAGPLGVIAILVLSLWMGFSFRVAKLLMERFSSTALLWIVPLTFMAQEVLRAEGLPLYRFAYLAYGYSQSANLWVAQIASLGGVYFVSFLLVAFNAALAYALAQRRRRAFGPVLVVGGVIVFLGVISQPSDSDAGGDLSVTCVQAESYNGQDYLDLTAQAVDQPDKPAFIVLPEHTIVEYADEKHPLVKALGKIASQNNSYICVGAHTRAPRGATCDYDNVALLISPAERIVGRQSKCVPIPFFADGNLGKAQEAIQTHFGPVGIYVCYDGSFTDIPRRLVAHGAGLLLVPVMNPQEWPKRQRQQQAEIARFRSIETRRWAVRAASSGISQIAAPDGQIHGQRLQEEGPGILCGRASFSQKSTLFVNGGYLFPLVVGIAFLVIVVWLTLAEWLKTVRLLVNSRRR